MPVFVEWWGPDLSGSLFFAPAYIDTLYRQEFPAIEIFFSGLEVAE
jgi:hypothetical protein